MLVYLLATDFCKRVFSDFKTMFILEDNSHIYKYGLIEHLDAE